MKNMKKFLAALLVLSMLFAMCGTALAAKFTEEQAAYGLFVAFTHSARGYEKPDLKSKTDIIVKEGSVGLLVDIRGDHWAKVVVTDGTLNAMEKTRELWFNTDYLRKIRRQKSAYIRCIFGSGGDDLSVRDTHIVLKALNGKRITTTGKVNLRKYGSLQGKSQGVIPKGTKLTCTGVVASDSRLVVFFQVRHNDKKYYVSAEYIKDWEDVILEALLEETGI